MRSVVIVITFAKGLAILVASCTSGQITVTNQVATTTTLHSKPDSSLVVDGLLYGKPCRPPCWQSITPGKSTTEQASESIENLKTSGTVNYIVGDSKVGYFVQPSTFSPNGAIQVDFENGLVKRVDGAIGDDLFYTVGSLIQQYGVPEGIFPTSGGNFTGTESCAEWGTPSSATPYVPVRLLYPEQGLYFLFLENVGNKTGFICPNTRVTGFCFYKPLPMQQSLENNYLANLCADDVLNGMGSVQDIE